MKEYVVTYIKPGHPDLPVGQIRLHEANCRYLRPTSARPYTGRRKATRAELAKQPKCKVC